MVYTKKNNMNVIISAKTYKIECINETIEKTIKNNKIYVLLLEYIKFIIFESFLKLSGIARYNIIPFEKKKKRLLTAVCFNGLAWELFGKYSV